jgi:hypothetical protein
VQQYYSSQIGLYLQVKGVEATNDDDLIDESNTSGNTKKEIMRLRKGLKMKNQWTGLGKCFPIRFYAIVSRCV